MSAAKQCTAPPIGGYPMLEGLRDTPEPLPYAPACYTQSARAGFAVFLQTTAVRRIWMPRYVCGVMPAVARELGVDIVWYALDTNLRPQVLEAMQLDDGFLCVNFFGLVDVRPIIAGVRAAAVLVDNAQAFFARPSAHAYSLYSPRKFFGVPDGGILVGHPTPREPTVQDEASISRCEHLLLRADGRVPAGYASFQDAEASLSGVEARAMSTLTRRILASIRLAEVQDRRRQNYAELNRRLGSLNGFAPTRDTTPDGPLCYPFLPEVPIDRRALAARGLFVPKYWQEALAVPGISEFERELVERLLPLPCDQRYDATHMGRVAELVMSGLT